MSQTIPHLVPTGPLRGKTALAARLYPNGEAVIYKERKMRLKVNQTSRVDPQGWYFWYRYYCFSRPLSHSEAMGAALGLSPLNNFDRCPDLSQDAASADAQSVAGVIEPPLRYGVKGITPRGARRVRNACHLIQEAGSRYRTVFATCTVPDYPLEVMASIHQSWHKVIDAYRRKLTRALQKQGLSGESVTVSEIQEKRYERTGIPVLHIHTVFCGVTRAGRWAISIKEHDEMWRESLAIALGHEVTQIGSACNLQRVKKSAEGYLGKYMTKGRQAVSAVVSSGFGGWMPKQWYGLTRSLGHRIDCETRDVRELADWLNDVAEIEGSNVWLWHRDVRIEMGDGQTITIARYGRLNIGQTARIRDLYRDSPFRSP